MGVHPIRPQQEPDQEHPAADALCVSVARAAAGKARPGCQGTPGTGHGARDGQVNPARGVWARASAAALA